MIGDCSLKRDLKRDLSKTTTESKKGLARSQGSFVSDSSTVDISEVYGEAVCQSNHDEAEDDERLSMFYESDSETNNKTTEIESDSSGVDVPIVSDSDVWNVCGLTRF